MSIQQLTKETIHYFDYKVGGTRQRSGTTLTGWRITTTDQATQHEHEYWVQDSEIFLIDLQAPKPWNHASTFVIGKRATRISSEERQAVTRAIAYWTPPLNNNAAHGRMIKLITEGPYVGVGFRRSIPAK